MLIVILVALIACFLYRTLINKVKFTGHDIPVYALALIAGVAGYFLLKWAVFLAIIHYAVVVLIIAVVFFAALNNRNKIPIK